MLEEQGPRRAGGEHMGPITEQRQVPGPVVYGYLLLTATCQTRRAALSRALAGYCEQHELALGAVFTDTGDDTVQAPGFTGLVIPTRAHLGHGRASGSRLAVIVGTGRRLMLIRGEPSPAGARSAR
jgi:hypothetical protein